MRPGGRATLSPAVMPGVERSGGLLPSVESLERVYQALVLLGVEVLASQLQPKRSREPTRAFSPAARIERFAIVAILVEHRDRQLRVVRPRAPIHVVRTDQGDLVVDHDDLRVYVDRRASLVLEVVDGDAVTARLSHQVEGSLLPQPMRRTADRPVPIRETGNDHDHAELRTPAQGIRERLAHLTRPEVLVLDIQERLRTTERLLIEARDRALPVRRKGIRGPASRICPEHLDRLGPAPLRLGDRRERLGHGRFVCRVDADPSEWGAPVLDRSGIVPALAERLEELRHRRALHLRLDVVPGGTFAVTPIQVLRLGIAEVLVAITSAVAEIDPADERQILVRFVRSMHDDELLMMGTCSPDPLVEQQLPAGCVDDVGEFGLLLLVEAHPGRMRAPQQPSHLHPSPRQPRQQTGQVRAVIGQLLVIVTTPIGQAEEVAGCECFRSLGETREIGASMDQRRHSVSLGPGATQAEPSTLLGVQEPRVTVAPLTHASTPWSRATTLGAGPGSTTSSSSAPASTARRARHHAIPP